MIIRGTFAPKNHIRFRAQTFHRLRTPFLPSLCFFFGKILFLDFSMKIKNHATMFFFVCFRGNLEIGARGPRLVPYNIFPFLRSLDGCCRRQETRPECIKSWNERGLWGVKIYIESGEKVVSEKNLSSGA